jgi:hypothetical protein
MQLKNLQVLVTFSMDFTTIHVDPKWGLILGIIEYSKLFWTNLESIHKLCIYKPVYQTKESMMFLRDQTLPGAISIDDSLYIDANKSFIVSHLFSSLTLGIHRNLTFCK